MILGGGPNRIGQGIEFDYCCVHAAFALREAGLRDDHGQLQPGDRLDRLRHVRPALLRAAHARGRARRSCEREKPEGVIVQFGGQTPLKLAVPLERAGVPILGTSPDAIDRAEDRERFEALLEKLGLEQPAERHRAQRRGGGRGRATRIGYPVLVRPVLRARRARDGDRLRRGRRCARYMARAVEASPEHPVLVDRFLEDAIEVDVDAICDGERVVIGGDHGAHRGGRRALGRQRLRAAAVLARRATCIDEIRRADARGSRASSACVGLMNVQFAVKDGRVYVLEVNPRASRTVPFVSKAIGVPLAKIAARVMAGKTLERARLHRGDRGRAHVAVKEAVFPFVKFPGVDTLLGPEMKSHRRGDGHRRRLRARVREGADRRPATRLPTRGRVFVSVRDEDRAGDRRRSCASSPTAGFAVLATPGTADVAARDRASRPRPCRRWAAARGELDTVERDPGRRRRPRDQHRRQRPDARCATPLSIRRTALTARPAVLHDASRRRARPRARSARCSASRSACAPLQEIHPSAPCRRARRRTRAPGRRQAARAALGGEPARAVPSPAALRPLRFAASADAERAKRVRDLDETRAHRAARAAGELAIPAEARERLDEARGATLAEPEERPRRAPSASRALLGELEALASPGFAERALARPLARAAGRSGRSARRRSRAAASAPSRTCSSTCRSATTTAAARDASASSRSACRATFAGEVLRRATPARAARTPRRVFEAVLGDGTGTVELKWFRARQASRGSVQKGARLLVTRRGAALPLRRRS